MKILRLGNARNAGEAGKGLGSEENQAAGPTSSGVPGAVVPMPTLPSPCINMDVVDTVFPLKSDAVTVIVLLADAPSHVEPWNGLINDTFVNVPPVELQLDVKLMFLSCPVAPTVAVMLIPVRLVTFVVFTAPKLLLSMVLKVITGMLEACTVKLWNTTSRLLHESTALTSM